MIFGTAANVKCDSFPLEKYVIFAVSHLRILRKFGFRITIIDAVKRSRRKMDEMKVMHGAECHAVVNCDECEYFDISSSHCVHDLIYDLSKLAAAKQPHLLQYEEIEEMAEVGDDCFWCEAKQEPPGTIYVSRWLKPFASTRNKIVCDVFGNTVYVDLFKEDYGRLWRAWSSRPSLEERSEYQW
jgi:hypothetical protein